MTLRPSPYLRHVESGTVSISATGQELAFGLARSLTLDATHLVRFLHVCCVALLQRVGEIPAAVRCSVLHAC